MSFNHSSDRNGNNHVRFRFDLNFPPDPLNNEPIYSDPNFPSNPIKEEPIFYDLNLAQPSNSYADFDPHIPISPITDGNTNLSPQPSLPMPSPPPSQPPPSPPHPSTPSPPQPSQALVPQTHRARSRKGRFLLRPEQSPTITPPFPWATDRRAISHNFEQIISENPMIRGDIHCKNCDRTHYIYVDVVREFRKIKTYIINNYNNMQNRAPKEWMNPKLMSCSICDQKECVVPIIGNKKRCINWMFLLLSGFLGFCKLNQLKYFCKHTGNHRTSAKDRLLYCTYLELCRQLEPNNRLFAIHK